MKTILFALLMTVSAFANEFAFDQSAPIFDQLKGYYNTGRNVTFDEVIGAMSGRCYNVDSKDTASGNVFIAHRFVKDITNGSPNNGPLFPPVTHKEMTDAYSITSNQDMNSIDNPSSGTIKSLRSYRDSGLNGSKVLAIDGVLTSVFAQPATLKYRVRAYDKYLVAELEQGGKIFNYCYFFKKIEL